MTEYRPIPDDGPGRATFFEYVRYAFTPGEGPTAYDSDEHDDERARMGARRGLYADDAPSDADPHCVCRHFWFDATVRGERHPTPGLSAVASPPESRRSGHVRRLLEASLEEYRDRGARFSVLWPFRYRFYRRYGWDTCNRVATVECEPDALSFATDRLDGAGSYRRIEADEYEAVEPVYEAHASGYALSLERDEAWWRHRVFTSWRTDPYVYAWERGGAVRGYVVYGVDGDWGDRTLSVRELAFVDHEALLALLSFCHTHDSQVSTVRHSVPDDLALLDLVPDPEALEYELETGPMVRLVDVAETLAALSYPLTSDQLTVSLAVDDPLVDWNDGTFTLTVEDGAATCEPTDREPDGRLDVGALSQLAVGYRTATDLECVDRLEARSETVEALERLFPLETVFLRDGF